MGGPEAPEPPDPVETAAAQTGTNINTTLANTFLNNYDQVGPDGTKTYKVTGNYSWTDPATDTTYDIPTFTEYTKLTPQGQKIRKTNDQTKLNIAEIGRDQSARIGDLLGEPLDMSGAPRAGRAWMLQKGLPEGGDLSSISSGDEARARAEEALMARLNPQLDRDRERLRSELSAQGIKLGSEAYDRGMSDYGQQANDARLAAILGAGQEASRVFDMDMRRFGAAEQQRGSRFNENLTRFNSLNTAREAALNEMMAVRNQPINEISALLSGSQVSAPQFGATPVNNIPITDYAGLVNNNFDQQMQIYQQEKASNDAMMGGLMSMAGTVAGAAMLSDARAKRDIRRIGSTDDGLGVYAFRYRGAHDDGRTHIGLMAQEVAEAKPEAVVTRPDGLLAVDYGKAV